MKTVFVLLVVFVIGCGVTSVDTISGFETLENCVVSIRCDGELMVLVSSTCPDNSAIVYHSRSVRVVDSATITVPVGSRLFSASGSALAELSMLWDVAEKSIDITGEIVGGCNGVMAAPVNTKFLLSRPVDDTVVITSVSAVNLGTEDAPCIQVRRQRHTLMVGSNSFTVAAPDGATIYIISHYELPHPFTSSDTTYTIAGRE